MTKKIIITILVLAGISTVAFADRFTMLINNKAKTGYYYIFIDNVGKVDSGQEAGQTAKGDVVDITPYNSQYKPTQAELDRYKVKIKKLTDKEIDELLEPDQTLDYYDENLKENIYIKNKARKRKLDMTNIEGKISEITITK